MTKLPLTRRSILTSAVAASLVPMDSAQAIMARGSFTHSVASGDPQPRKVMLWTRFVPTTPNTSVTWEIARDANFSKIEKTGTVNAKAERDYCCKVDVVGLTPNTRYYYRFRVFNQTSAVGETRTLPVGKTDKVTLGVFSCSNLPFGYFQAYRDAVKRGDIDVALHLGDYIYEYQRGVYPSVKEAMADREINPAGEVIALSDYRVRYANYRSDPDLQEIHRKIPFIVIWDDHEFSNDTWKGGAQNHQTDVEGPWLKRRAAAIQAYYEWMPIREMPAGRIYRRFDFGTLASLIMLDTRMIGRDEQLDYKKDLKMSEVSPRPEDVKTAATAFKRKWNNPSRSMLGLPQEKWFAEQVRDSAAKKIPWQIIGQQVQVGFLKAPKDLPKYLPKDAPEWLRGRVELGALMSTQDLPANLDSWSGYPAARTRFIEVLAKANNPLVLTGDTHNAWLFEIGDAPDGRAVTIELGGHSVSSPGYEGSIKIPPESLSEMLRAENKELKWCNTYQRGYMVVTLTAEKAINEWVFMDNIREKNTSVVARHKVQILPSAGNGVNRAQVI
jgi:alkaline phosphatase D